jgi:hypothetical protein
MAIYPRCTTLSTIISIAPVLQEVDTKVRPSSAVAASYVVGKVGYNSRIIVAIRESIRTETVRE